MLVMHTYIHAYMHRYKRATFMHTHSDVQEGWSSEAHTEHSSTRCRARHRRKIIHSKKSSRSKTQYARKQIEEAQGETLS